MAATITPMTVDKRAKEIESEYLSSLADLNVNSKPLINMLTLLADDNLNYAQIIVGTIEKHLAKVEPDVKLPLLYLVDSIVKNVGKEYQSLFSQVIVSMFCGVFETVNERVREKMFSLRQTWNDVFPQSKLYALDIKVNAIDPGWPITAQLKSKSPAIHVNPMFLKNKVAEPNLDMQQQLRDKQRELLELQAKKLELELLATKKRIEEQEKQLILQTASVSKEPTTDLKRAAPAARATSTPAPVPRGRIVPPNPAMLNLVKSRDPRLARQQAQMAAQMAAASTNSTPTVVSGVQIPHQPVALDPSGKPLSIKERLGRIPKRVDPRTKAQSVEDQKKPSSTTGSSITSTTTSHKSRADYESSKKRDRKEEARAGGKGSSSSKSSNADRKKPSSDTTSSPKGSSPSKKKSSSADKSPSRGADKASTKSREPNSKSSKSGKTRRPHESSNSSDNSSISPVSSSENLVPVANDSKDVDLRLLIPEKKLKLDQPSQQAKLVSKPPLAEQSQTIATYNSNLTEKAPEEEAPADVDGGMLPALKDIDLRIPPPAVLLKKANEPLAATPGGLAAEAVPPVPAEAVAPVRVVSPMVQPAPAEVVVVKKRPSNSSKYEEPIPKKSKMEKIDILFGAEDVDLRKLTAPMNAVEIVTPLPPPPPIISESSPQTAGSSQSVDSSDVTNPVPSSKAALEAVRAKIAEATKKDRDKLGRPLLYNKLPDDPAERRRSFNQPKSMDVDLRQPAHLQPLGQSKEVTNEDNSQDGMNANIKTIITQAQEQMEQGEITPEQYNILMKQVIQLNETQKIRQAQRMEMMKRTHAGATLGNVITIDESTRSPRDEMTATASPKEDAEPPKQPQDVPGGPPIARNDFRGKITPMDAKPVFPAAIPELRQRDPRRVRESRFNQPLWGNRGPVPGAGPILNPAPPTGPPLINHRPPGPMLNPWEQPPFPIMDTNIPPVGGIGPRFAPVVPGPVALPNGLPPQTMVMPGVPKVNESVRTIKIDGIQREVRFYDDIAVIFMSWDEPKEIGFQKGSRMVSVDDRDSFELSFNECYKAITIDGKVYQMKLGAPTRELYIDNSWYECYFGDPPTTIVLDGLSRVFNISGPAPQVKIGQSRNDLVAGRIKMIVNAETTIPVYLDSQVQMIEIQGQMHKLQFADFLLTVLINDQPFVAEYGGLPKIFKLRGKDYYIRFTAVPKLVVPGRVYIRDMIRTPLHRDLRTPPRDQSMMMPYVPPISNFMPSMPPHAAMPGIFPAATSIPPPPQAPMQPMATGLDYLTNLMPHASTAVNVSNNLAGYQIQNEDKPVIPVSAAAPPASTTASLPILQNINIDELYKKIVAAGILAKSNSAPLSTSTSSTSVSSKLDKVLDELEEIEPVLLNKPDTLKRRQSAIVTQLFSGMQCSSCGVRFPPEQTMKYSQHLDWHFRQNRRDRDSARKAHSRKWYYDVSDWIQYEEIEDLEEREKNWFETQQTEQNEFNADGEQAGRTSTESPLPSCPAGSDETDKRCHVCHDDFEQFYNEETEEWHLKNALRVEDSTYHPLCYEDYKASLVLEESVMNITGEAEQSKIDDDDADVKIKQEVISDADDTVKEITIDDDDDVIVLPPSEEVVTEIPDDDDIETLDSHSTADGASNVASKPAEEDIDKKIDGDSESNDKVPIAPPTQTVVETRIDDDLAIQEPTIENITVNDLDESEEAGLSAGGMLEAALDDTSQIKVKEEPKDDDEVDEEDALFEDVGTIESSLIIQETPIEPETVDVEAVPSPPTVPESTSQSQIDGNLDMQDTTPATAVITNRIKINITKAKTTTNSSNTSSSNATVSSSTNSASGTTSSSSPQGSSIAVLISGGGGAFNENGAADDLLYGNMDDVHGGNNENSQSSNNQLIMMMHEEDVDDSNKKPAAAAEEEQQTDIAYDLKPSLQGVGFTRKPKVESGFETSGLCSIM
ncbi:uncharacterized protein LOC128744695 isoform X2 [Sabethes cyaneus]|uniref:uncharacterized protein LOC128744695 isoform X2 n=1 Tax=Sabethes cyaneus TaxID=53552 RepID=UPI00237E9DB2|nr:uncharacterized protein LOC128744695 isoform X2 [Sabethes cyaneus]